MPIKKDLSPQQKDESSFSFKAAAYLNRKSRHIIPGTRPPNLEMWKSHFEALQRCFPKKEIKQVLQWHCAKLQTTAIIKAYSAKSFCARFEEIRSAMQKSGVAAAVEIDEDGESYAERLFRDYVWEIPEDDVKTFAQLNVNAYLDFAKRLQAYCDIPRKPIDGGYPYFAYEVLMDMAPEHVESALERFWMQPLRSRIDHWKKFDGDYFKHVFCPFDNYFRTLGRRWSMEYTGGCREWDDLMIDLYPERAAGTK